MDKALESQNIPVDMRFPSFEALLRHARKFGGKFWMPNAYGYRQGKWDQHFDWYGFQTEFDFGGEFFTCPNPPLYIARTRINLGHALSNTCVALPSNQPLLGDNPKYKFIKASSTQDAAQKCANREAPFCITNHTGIEKYQLEIIEQLKHTVVVWICYTAPNKE